MSGPPPNPLWRHPTLVELIDRYIAARARAVGLCPACNRRVYYLVEGYCVECNHLGYTTEHTGR